MPTTLVDMVIHFDADHSSLHVLVYAHVSWTRFVQQMDATGQRPEGRDRLRNLGAGRKQLIITCTGLFLSCECVYVFCACVCACLSHARVSFFVRVLFFFGIETLPLPASAYSLSTAEKNSQWRMRHRIMNEIMAHSMPQSVRLLRRPGSPPTRWSTP